MTLRWNLREWLRNERGVTGATEAARIIVARTGYKISTQAVCDLFNDQPKMLRVETLEALCSAFYCRLSDFCEVLPGAATKPELKTAGSLDRWKSPSSTMISAETASATSLKETDSLPGIDFAAFFPDARIFS